VIVTDKTGTLTESRMQVAAIFPADRGDDVLRVGIGNVSVIVSDPLERALADAAAQRGLPPPAGEILRVRPVGDGRKTKATLRREGGQAWLVVSGAPEEVARLAAAPMVGGDEFLTAETARGRRLIAVARRLLAAGEENATFDQLEHDLELVGLVSFEDPPRPGVAETLARAAEAGIRTIMVTGDHPATAACIARQVGIPAAKALTGAELDTLPHATLTGVLREVSVFARTTPEHKLRIVTALQQAGEVVAVTGDGVNDALALKAADVGIAMGIRGTDVAREAAGIVLADDNYVTIIQGVFAGRKFYDNLKKGVSYYLAVKLGLIFIFLLPVLAGLPMPFSPIQIIVLELFMDLAASAGFVAEPAEAAIYARQPRRRGTADLLDTAALRAILLKGMLLFAAVMAAYGWMQLHGAAAQEVQTAAFAAWMAGHVTLAFISRAQTQTLRAIGPWRNRMMNFWALGAIGFFLVASYSPGLHTRFGLVPLPPVHLAAIMLAAIAITGVAEAIKLKPAALPS
jgi:Ca2+-transporting ATPase